MITTLHIYSLYYLYIVYLRELIPLDDVKGDNVLLAQHKSIIIKKNQ